MKTHCYDEKRESPIEPNFIENRNDLIKGNQGLVISIAKRYVNKHIPIEDLIQEGFLGLIVAAERFDIKRGCQFSTYAVYYIRDYVIRAVRKAMKGYDSLFLDISMGKDEDSTLIEYIIDEDEPLPYEVAEQNEQRQFVAEMVSCLKPQERRIIELRFGMNSECEHSFREIGKLLNLSKEQVRQIEVKALKRLRDLAVPFRNA
jgi:RNA polymerase sigma factor (sigma-70 family)